MQFCADFSKKSKSIKEIYIYACERSRYALSENGIDYDYCAMNYYLGDISVWSWRNLLNFCWVSIFFDILIVNFSWTVAQTPINHSIFWKSVMRTLRCIYVNCFNDTHMKDLALYWKNSLKYKVGCFWRFSYVYTIN